LLGSNLALIFRPNLSNLFPPSWGSSSIICLTSSRIGLTCSPSSDSKVVAFGDAYPPFEVKSTVGLRGQRPLPGQPGCRWEGGEAVAASPHDNLNPKGFHQGFKPAGRRPAVMLGYHGAVSPLLAAAQVQGDDNPVFLAPDFDQGSIQAENPDLALLLGDGPDIP
jgi:hypothetical protein